MKELGFWRKSRSVPVKARFTSFHQTTKVSPYLPSKKDVNAKKNALWWCLGDLQILPKSLIESIKTVGGQVLSEKIDTLFRVLKEFPEVGYLINTTPSNNFRKLSWFPDKELKVRIIAIGDYFSQTALKPLHRFLFRILKRIPQDRTFAQGHFDLTGFKTYYSFDLSAATDRFPIDVIILLLQGFLPQSYTKAWRDIMVGYPFKVSDTRKEYSYSTGNPMGFYSSWATFALAHHFIVYVACMRCNIK